jgi:phenylacetate-CoA ligase
MKAFEVFVKKVSSPIIARGKGLPRLFQCLEELEVSQYWDRNRIVEFQFEKLKKLLLHAYENTTFYRRRFDKAGVNPYKLQDPEEIRNIPILTKREIRENITAMIAKGYRKNQLDMSETGGTTGVKLLFYRDKASLSLKKAAVYRFEKWAGWDFGERMAMVWPASADYVGYYTWETKLMNELFGRQVVLPDALLDDHVIQEYVDQLIKKRPTMVRGFASPIYEVASYINRKGIELPLKGAITTGEPLFIHQRKIIEEAFHCKVLDSYRTREAGSVAQQCQELYGLHINAECLYVEIESQNSTYDGTGEIIITDLVNYGMPFIRYQIGDVGKISFEPCPCGRGLPMLKNILGRTFDIFFGPDGKRVMSINLVRYLVYKAPGLLGQVQIIQDRLDHLVIRMTPDPPPTDEIKNYQISKVKELLGPQMKVSFEIVDKIPREESGKYRFTICKISK